jgi:MAF protein
MVRGDVNSPQLYLASNSPRRRELMSLGGWNYKILVVQVDETPLPDEGGIEYVQRLANSKMAAAARQEGVEGMIVAADTTVIGIQEDESMHILGKPRDRGEAADMLRGLRGRLHQVHTAVSILSTHDGTVSTDLCTTRVMMRHYGDEEIEAYIASGDPMDKAGAYAIQHAGFHPVEKLEGCFANVMGLPLCHLSRSLAKLNIAPKVDITLACQTETGFKCPVSKSILDEKIFLYNGS